MTQRFSLPVSAHANQEIKSLQKSFDLMDEGELKDYLGTRFIKHKDSQIKLQQQKTM